MRTAIARPIRTPATGPYVISSGTSRCRSEWLGLLARLAVSVGAVAVAIKPMPQMGVVDADGATNRDEGGEDGSAFLYHRFRLIGVGRAIADRG